MVDQVPGPEQSEEAKWQAAQYFLGQCGVEGNLDAVFSRFRDLNWELDFCPFDHYLNFKEPSTESVLSRAVYFSAIKSGEGPKLRAEAYPNVNFLEDDFSDCTILEVESINVEHYGQTFDLVIKGHPEDVQGDFSIVRALFLRLNVDGAPGIMRVTTDIMANPKVSAKSS